MPKVEAADQATEIAVNFLKEYYRILHRPLMARQEQGKWVVEVDVGVYFAVVAKVTIDAETGTILEYQVPPPPFPSPPPRPTST
ncbi:MAG TPA: hypothetical protein VFA32_04275 [Dehalococcoidia bacterium]|jgi:hypothetical protein|nr:hypothetical protein [Dehalococcoidia bacterium]